MTHRMKLLAAALAAEDERSFWLLLEHLIRDTKPRRRASLLWC